MEQIIHHCNKCGAELNDETWSPYYQKTHSYVCKKCNNKRARVYQAANPDKRKEYYSLRIENPKNIIGKVCRICGVELNDDNWYITCQKKGDYICNECKRKKYILYREDNTEISKAINVRARRKAGQLPISENKNCASYFGIHINERMLRHKFNDVEVMPFGNPGYDFICNHGKKIDCKSGCINKNGNGWQFRINYNTTADYFLCVAYDNRADLNPLHIWMLPGDKFNHLSCASISESTLDKWGEYEQDITEVVICCEEIKSE